MRKWDVKIPFPEGWESVPGESRSYRRGVDGGWVRLSLYPPLPELDSGEAVLDHLRKMLAELEVDVGEEVQCAHGDTQFGLLATTLRRSSEQGLLRFWLVVGQITLFASYVMGALKEAKRDLAEAHQAIKAVELELVT